MTIGISKNDCPTSLDCEDTNFSSSMIWTSSSILDDNDDKVSCEGKHIEFSIYMIWTSLFFLDNNDNEISCKGNNSVRDKKDSKPSGRSSTLISLNSSTNGCNLAGISNGEVTFSFISMSSFC